MAEFRYNHAFDFAFGLETDAEAEDVTGRVFKAALLRRALSIPEAEFVEACGCFDTIDWTEDEDNMPLSPEGCVADTS